MKKLRYYFLILNHLYSYSFPSRENLLAYLRVYDIDISERTFYRALRELYEEYGIEVCFNTVSGGYYIESNSLTRSKVLHSCLKDLITNDILLSNKKAKWNLLNYVSIENRANAVPIDNLDFILSAIMKKRKIKFNYFNSEKNVTKSYEIAPLFFKQYNDCWYLIGKRDFILFDFALAAIKDVEVMSETFYENVEKAKMIYEEVIGLKHNQAKLEEIELVFDKNHEYVLHTTPIHNSQIVDYCEVNDVLNVKLTIRPNAELKKQLLKFGSAVEVLKPKWLRDEIINEFEYALSHYNR